MTRDEVRDAILPVFEALVDSVRSAIDEADRRAAGREGVTDEMRADMAGRVVDMMRDLMVSKLDGFNVDKMPKDMRDELMEKLKDKL